MKRKWPPLPTKIYGPGGSITVEEVEKTQPIEGDATAATWDAISRIIQIERGLSIQQRWRYFFHEWMHAVLADSGLVHLMTDEAQEALCDAVATARLVEMAGTSN